MTSQAPTLVLLAGGVGRRYGGTKQLDPLGPEGEILLEYSLFDARRAGFARAVVVVRPDAEDLFREQLDRGASRGISIVYAHQRAPRGTADALLAARDHLDGPFAVANADDVYGPASFKALGEALRSDAASGWVVGFDLQRTLSPHGPVSRAICHMESEESDVVCRLEERLQVEAGSAHVSLNLWGFPQAALPLLEASVRAHEGPDECRLPSIVGSWIEAGHLRLRMVPSTETWAGITWPDDRTWVRHRLEQATLNDVYDRPLWRHG